MRVDPALIAATPARLRVIGTFSVGTSTSIPLPHGNKSPMAQAPPGG
jgi:hypothetical protein